MNGLLNIGFWRRPSLLASGTGMGVLVLLAALLGCSPLDTLIEPEIADLQLTVDTLKSTIRDTQRTIGELRAELDSRRQELAEVQIARAQLEGRVREAERRLVEARQVIDLQREELAGSRSERERIARTGAALHQQLKQLQQHMAKLGKGDGLRGSGTAPAGLPSQRRQGGMSPMLADQSPLVASPALHVTDELPTTRPAPVEPAGVVVKPGDTLWSISRRSRVSVKRLMAINQLSDSRIQAGQTLWLSEPAAGGEPGDGLAP